MLGGKGAGTELTRIQELLSQANAFLRRFVAEHKTIHDASIARVYRDEEEEHLRVGQGTRRCLCLAWSRQMLYETWAFVSGEV